MQDIHESGNLEFAAALGRLVAVAQSDTGQSRRVADFLLAWWNATECGGFDIADLFAVDLSVAKDMAIVFVWLAGRNTAIYADAFDLRDEMVQLAVRWRSAN